MTEAERLADAFAGGRAPRLYTDLAHLWPALSPPEHYEAEAAIVRAVLTSQGLERGARLLELGAGGGHIIHYLLDDYEITAVDLSPAMLKNCQALNPTVECIVGDMRSLDLGRTFDAVLIHDAVDYLLSPAEIEKTVASCSGHLRPGGVLLVAPTYVRDEFEDGEVEMDTGSTDEFDLTYVSLVHDPDPNDTEFEMVLLYLIRDCQTRKLETIEDRHICGLFSEAQWLTMMREGGFEAHRWQPKAEDLAQFDDPTWTLFVGRK